MSVEIDKRVVEMQFDNKQFERNVQTSLKTIDKLKMALDFDGAKGLEGITKAANKIDLSNISKETERVQVSFSALQVAGMTVISELTRSFLNFGKNIWNMSLGQIKSGGMARTLKIEQAEFKLKALAQNILKVEEGAKELDAYVKKMSDAASNAVQGTAYGYDSAMSVVSQLVASGINDAETMESYLKGIAGAAAMTGRSFDDIGRIFSTVASNGKLMTMQLRQFSAAGFNVAAVLADNLGTTEAAIGDMVQKGQISFETFAEVISKAYGDAAQKADDTFSGVTSNIKAQLSRVGQLFTDPYVKHMVPFLQKVKAAVKELREALVPTSERFDRFFKRLTEYAAVIVDQIDFSRLDTIVRGIENLLFGLAGILYTVYQAFRDVFDKKTVEELREMAFNFERLTESLLPTAEALDGIRTSFKFLFSLLKVGVKIVNSLQKVLKPLVVYIFRILGSIISLVRHLEPLADSIIKFLKESSLLEVSMEIIAGIIETICNGIVILINILDSLFGDVVTISTFKKIGSVLKDISDIINSVIIVSLLLVYSIIRKIMSLINPNETTGTINKIKDAFRYLFNIITFGFDTILELMHGFLNSDTLVTDLINVVKEIFGLFSDIAKGKDLEERLGNLKLVLEDVGKSFQKFVEDFKSQMRDISLGKLLLIAFAVGAIMLIFSLQRLTEAMTKFTNTARNTINIGATINKAFNSFANYSPAAQTLITFAIAVAALSSALMTLSQVEDTEKLLTAGKILGAFAAGLLATAVTLTLVYKYFAYTGQGGNIAHLAFVMISISASLMLLIFAVKAMANLTTDLNGLLKVSASVIALMTGLALSVGAMSKLAPEFKASMWSILAFATGTLILVKALDMLKSFDISSMWRQAVLLGGLMVALGVAIGLASRAAKVSKTFTNNKAGTIDEFKKGSIGGSLLMFALSMKILLGVFKDLCAMPISQLNSGIKKIRELLLGSFIPLFLSFSVINKLSGSSGGFIADVSKLMMSMATSMVVIFTAISLFSIIPEGDLTKAVTAMSNIMTAIGKMMALIFVMPVLMTLITSIAQTKTSRKIKSGTYDLFTNLKGIVLALAGLVVAISVLAVVAKGMTMENMAVVTDMLILIGSLVVLTEFASTFTKGAKATPIIASITMIIAVVGAIAFLAATMATGGLDLGTLQWISVCLGALFASLGIMFAGLGKYTNAKGTPTGPAEKSSPLLGTLLVIAILGSLVAIVKFAQDVKFETIIAIFVGMFAVIGILIALVSQIKKVRVTDYARLGESMKVIYPAIALFATMVASFIALSLVLNSVSDSAWGKALATLGFISLLMLTMGVVLDKAGENAGVLDDVDGVMSTMWSMVLMVSVLGVVIAAITAIPAKQGYVAKLVLLGVIVGALVVFLDRCDFGSANDRTLKHMRVFAESFAIMCAGVIAIAGAIALVSNADFSEGSGIGYKLAALSAGIILMTALFIFLTKESKKIGYVQLLATSATIISMTGSLLLIAEAIKNIASIPGHQLAAAEHVLTNLLVVMGALAAIAGAISGIPGFGEAFDTGLLVISIAMISFGATLIMLAKSVKIFTEAVHELAKMSTEDIDKVVNNINRFLEQLPVINQKLEEFGPDLAKTIALWIQYVAMGFAMSLGSLVSVGFTAVIAFLAGFLMALPAILDAIKLVLEITSDWIIENKDVITNAFKATFEAILAAGEGMIDAFFDYYGISLEEFLNASKYKIEAQKRNEEITRKTDNKRMQAIYTWYDQEKALIDAGASEFDTYQDAASKAIDMAEAMYKENLLTQQEVKDLVKDIQGVTDVDWEEYFKPLDYYRKQREYAKEENTSDFLHSFLGAMMTLTGQDASDIDRQAALNRAYYLNDGLSGIYTPYLNRSDEDVELLLRQAKRDGMEAGEYFSEGFNAGLNNTSFTNKILEGVKRTGGASMATNAANNIVKIIPTEALHDQIMKANLKALPSTLINTKKLKDDIKPDMEKLGENVADSTGDGVVSGVKKNAGAYVDKIVNTFGPYAEMIGFDLSGDFANGLLSGLSGVLTGEGGGLQLPSVGNFKTAGQWREYYSEMIPIVKEINGMQKTVGSTARWRSEGFASLDEAVRANSKFGEDWFNNLTGFKDTIEEAKDLTSDFVPSVEDMTSGLDELGDTALETSEKTDKLSDSIKSTLDIFTAFNKEANITSREVLKNFYSQIDGIKTWQTELEALASRGFNQNFLTELADQGPDAYEKIHALYTMTEQDLTLFNKMYAEKLVMQNTTADEIRKSFVEFGVMLSDDAELIGEDLGAKYDEAVAKAQAEAAKKKNGQMSDATKKRLAQMYDTIQKYQADQDFIKKWYDSNAVIGETAGEAIADGMSNTTTEGIIGTAAYIEAGKEMVEMIGKGIDKASPDILKGLENLGYASTETLKNSIEFEKVLTPVNEFRKGVYNQVKSSLKLFDEVKVKTDEELKEEQISTTQMLYNMNENLKRVGKWSYQLRQLAAKGMSEGLVEELRQMGPEAADKVDAFARMSASELKMANRYYEESVQATSSIADRMTSEYAKQGFAVALGLKEGVDEGKDDLLAKMYEIGAESSEGFKKGIDPDAANTAMILLGNNSLIKLMEALDVHSPSRKTYDIGVNTILGLTEGIADPTANAELLTTIADLGLKVKQAYDEATDEKYIRRPVSDFDNDIYQPVIRPMVDMSGVEFGIASFFANRQFSLSGTINNAFAAQRTGPSPDAIMITNAIDRLSVEQRAIRNDINNIRSDVSNLGNRIDGMKVVLDGNALVGELVAPLDKAMGKKVISQKRGRM